MDTNYPQDEFEKVRLWWKTYGTAVIYGVLLGVALLLGITYWNQHRTDQAEGGSALYEQLVVNYERKQVDEAKTAAAKLIEDYAGTPYAGKAALYLATINYQAKNTDAAQGNLRWAMEHAREQSVQHTARLRLGRILLAQQEFDEAFALTQVKERDGFESLYQELRGDVLAKKGEVAEARKAYRAAQQNISPGSPYSRVLEMKLDDLGPEQLS